MTVFGYARASVGGKALGRQVEALEKADCEKIVIEQVRGAKDRPELTKLLATLGGGDVLVVSRLDCLAHSSRDLFTIIEGVAQRKATFRSLHDPWADTTTPAGRVMQTVLGGLAEFERGLIRARTGDGRVRAVARGQHMGRPSALSPYQQQRAADALATGTTTQADLARQFNVSQSTISRLAEKIMSPPVKPTPAVAPS